MPHLLPADCPMPRRGCSTPSTLYYLPWRRLHPFTRLLPVGNPFLFVFGGTSLCCCAPAFSLCGKQELLSSCGAQTSHCSSFSCCRAWLQSKQEAQWLYCISSTTLQPVESSQTRDQTCAPCIGRQILNHWNMQVSSCQFLNYNSNDFIFIIYFFFSNVVI